MKARDILKDLVAINTIADKQNHEIMDYIEDFYSKLGVSVERRANPKTGKEVLIASYGEDPAMGFMGHTDTVDITDDERLIINGNQVIETNIFSSTPRYEGFLEYPVTLGANECFVLADKRQGGTDSRYFGPVSKDKIAGTVITILRRLNL